MKKDKLVHGFKMYNYVMQEVWKLLTTLLFGVLAGYLLRKNGPEDNYYFVKLNGNNISIKYKERINL